MTDTKQPEKKKHKVPTAHDTFVKFMWKDIARAKTMLRLCLPTEVAAKCNLEELRLEDGSFVDPDQSAKHSDIIYSTALGARAVRLHVVWEHKSASSWRTTLQSAGYVLRGLERYADGEGKRSKTLPLTMSVVLHHSKKGWRAPTELLEMYGAGAKENPEVVPWLLNFRIALFDLSHKSDEELRASALDLASLLAM